MACRAGGFGEVDPLGRDQGGFRGFPSVPSSLRVGPARQGRSFVASLRDGLRPPLTARPATEIRKTAGKPPKERAGCSFSETGRLPCAGGARARLIATRSWQTAPASPCGRT
ncbi:hypothetical protein BSL84_14550 [Streptomyces sp. TN58]|nr:hypothetical protein BSL84_14550 [Streptomyces sp. TN58]